MWSLITRTNAAKYSLERTRKDVNLINTISIFPPSVWETWVSRTFWCPAESDCPSLSLYFSTVSKELFKNLRVGRLAAFSYLFWNVFVQTSSFTRSLNHRISCVEDITNNAVDFCTADRVTSAAEKWINVFTSFAGIILAYLSLLISRLLLGYFSFPIQKR